MSDVIEKLNSLGNRQYPFAITFWKVSHPPLVRDGLSLSDLVQQMDLGPVALELDLDTSTRMWFEQNKSLEEIRKSVQKILGRGIRVTEPSSPLNPNAMVDYFVRRL